MKESSIKINSSSTLTLWVDLYSDKLYSWAYHKTSSKEMAEDLVQETFLAAVQSFEKFEEKSNPSTWLFSILNHKINDYYRSSFRLPTVNESNIVDRFFDETDTWKQEERPHEWDLTSDNLLDDVNFLVVLDYCLKNLPDSWNSAVRLKFLEEKKGEIICQELGISTTNLWQIVHRAKLQLRKCLEINWFTN
ncbi:MAG: sigma-70 family RNA polymerase sigma factor [Paludibacter sp.]|nr:sigma-70 family RNA polymerase sigma factor [Paludibacter sp.]